MIASRAKRRYASTGTTPTPLPAPDPPPVVPPPSTCVHVHVPAQDLYLPSTLSTGQLSIQVVPGSCP